MRSRKDAFGFCFLSALAATVPFSNAHAAALLKPTSGPTQALRPKALDIKTRVDGAWAQTTVTTVYARNSKQQIEADLLYTAPEGAVVTGFAYWFGKEKVTARVTERERAAEISEASDAGEVDPAWVQLVGKNVFRARLHAIKPGRDLRIEVKFAQPLQGEGAASVWKYPLINETRDVTLDWLRLRVEADDVSKVRNNYGALVSGDEISVRKYNFKPENDVRLSFPRRAADFTAQLTSEHQLSASGQAAAQGYFALTLNSPVNPTDAPKITGINTFEVMAPEQISPGQIRLFGRYSGSGAATVSWGGRQTVVWFPPAANAEREIQGLAAPLWGTHRMAAAAGGPKARITSVTLSKRFNILSPWTSLVAIPAEQRKIIDAQLQQIDLRKRGEALGKDWAMEVENKQPLSPRALQARAGLRALERSSLGRRYGFNEETSRSAAIKIRLAELARLVMARRMNVRDTDPQAPQKMNVLASFSEENFHPFLQTAQQSLRRAQVEGLAARWMSQVVALKGQTPEAVKLKESLDELQSRYGMEHDYAAEAYRKATTQIAYSVIGAALTGRENEARTTQLIDTGERFVRKIGESSFRNAFYEPALSAHLQKARDQLLGEIESGRDQSEGAIEAQTLMRQVYSLAPGLRSTLRQEGSVEWEVDCARRGLAHETAYRIAQTRAARPDDQTTIRQLEARLERISSQTEQDAEDFIEEETNRLRKGQPLLSARQFRLAESGISEADDAQSLPTRSEPQLVKRDRDPLLSLDLPTGTRFVEAILPSGETKNLVWNPESSTWETHFYGPHFERGGRFIIALRVVDAQGKSKITTIDLTPVSAETWNVGVWSRSATAVTVSLPWEKRLALPCLPTGQFASPLEVPLAWRTKKPDFKFSVGDKNSAMVASIIWS
jgi:hypothetical protein